MEKHKWRYLDSILERNPLKTLKDYINEMVKWEYVVRSCYSDDVYWERTEFVEMILLDGCFIVEFFIKLKKDLLEMDPLFSTSWMLVLIGYDMLLLENQIPFIVLLRIFEMAILDTHKPFKYSLVELAFDFFFNFFHEIMPSAYKVVMMDCIPRPHHLLDLFHWYLIPTQTLNNQSNLPIFNRTVESKKPFFLSKVLFPCSNSAKLPISNHQSPLLSPPSTPQVTSKMIPCVAELQLAGVKFKKRVEWSSILEVKFSNGVLEIPPLSINSYTKTLFRNLLMFEECYPKARICFMTYIVFMDCIINTSKDVALLHRNGIINHLMGSNEEVAHLFNSLGYGLFDFQNNYLSDLYKDVEKHCKTKWNMWWASLRRNYFTSPWAGLATLAAAIVILATIIQAIFAILSYK
ncbi:UPF0481 protein At3g47200-like [Magnolia sinica]|uniref:UPF0481 protein At3g47200-like n=1 Tax=Magnolia sinica TaxID=86752 RepID=UPI002657D187|nr:UPF0481 protein At3g47200-like [Magnolia sinica]